jgi:hypothetical protein
MIDDFLFSLSLIISEVVWGLQATTMPRVIAIILSKKFLFGLG